MHSFKDFNIKPQAKSFEGDKIKIDRLLNKQILVEEFKIDESKYKDKGTGKLLTIQIFTDNSKRILFTGSSNLIEMIKQVPKEKFPFYTSIIKENGRFEFT